MSGQQPPGLTNMPGHVVNKIAEYVSFPGVLKMRNVCKKLRTDLDHHRPSIFHDAVELKFYEDHVTAIHYEVCPFLFTRTHYRRDPLGVAIEGPVHKLQRLENYMRRFSQDFVLNIFKHKAKIGMLRIRSFSDTAVGDLKASLSSLLDHRWQKPQVKMLVLELSNVEDIDSILPLFDPNAIRKIELTRFQFGSPLEFSGEYLEKLSRLDCWRNATEVRLERDAAVLSSPASIGYFLHLKNFEVFIEVLGLEELKKVMETMKTPNSKLESAVIEYDEFPAKKVFSEGLGNPINGTEQKGPNKEFLIEISHHDVRIEMFNELPVVYPPEFDISFYIVPF